MWEIEFLDEAQEDLQWFRKYDQTRILEGIKTQLEHRPDVETRNRKKLRPEHKGEWELRIRSFRVFYDLDSQTLMVRIVAIGHKERNRLFFRGKEYSP